MRARRCCAIKNTGAKIAHPQPTAPLPSHPDHSSQTTGKQQQKDTSRLMTGTAIKTAEDVETMHE